MKILEVISDTNIGGAGRLLLERLGKSAGGGDEIFVLLPRGSQLAPRVRESACPESEGASGVDDRA